MRRILTAVVASVVFSSKLLLMAGFHSLRLRYPIAVLVSYGVFLGLVRVWLWYASIRRDAGVSLGSFDGGNGFSWGGGSGWRGQSKVRDILGVEIQEGAGASDVRGESGAAEFAAAPAPSGVRRWFPSLVSISTAMGCGF